MSTDKLNSLDTLSKITREDKDDIISKEILKSLTNYFGPDLKIVYEKVHRAKVMVSPEKLEQVAIYLRDKNLVLARNRFWKSILNNPFQLKIYIYFLVTLAGKRGFDVLNGGRKLLVRVINSSRRLKYNRLSKENLDK